MTKYLCFQYNVTYGTAVTRTEVTLCWRNQCETVQLLTLTPDFIAPAPWPANSSDLNPVDYEIYWGKLQRVYRSRIRDSDPLKSHLIKSGNISTRCSSMKRSVSSVHIFELAFEHTEDILNTDLKYVWYLHRRKLWQSHVCAVAYIATMYVLGWYH